MINSVEDLHAMLMRLDRQFQSVDGGVTLVHLAKEQAPAALRLSDPVLVAQVEFGAVPEPQGSEGDAQNAALFRQLLEYNASDLLHASYAIAQQTIVLVAALELVSLDANELEAVLSDFDMALSAHTPKLRRLIGAR